MFLVPSARRPVSFINRADLLRKISVHRTGDITSTVGCSEKRI
jgi:hypothetical protein